MRARDIEVLIELEKLIERQRQNTHPPHPSEVNPDEPKPDAREFEPGWKTWCQQAGKN